MIVLEPLALRVADIEILSPSLRRLMLESADGRPLPTSLPGAHLSLQIEGPDRLFRNSYSLVTHHDERSRYEIIVRRTEESRGGSHFIHDMLKPGDRIVAATPNSQFPLQNRARKHLLISGGIGVTPFLSFLPVLRERAQRFELHQFAQPDEVAIFEALLDTTSHHMVHVHSGRRSRALLDILSHQPLGTHVYTCGPAALMDGVAETAQGLGWPANHVHLESFGAAGGEPFTVRLGKTGGEIEVGAHETMLEALEDAGIPVPSLCRGGACGECCTRVIEGSPEHRDHYLSDTEKSSGTLVMPCVSRARSSTLTLDL